MKGGALSHALRVCHGLHVRTWYIPLVSNQDTTLAEETIS
jgi:hypothetical protein